MQVIIISIIIVIIHFSPKSSTTTTTTTTNNNNNNNSNKDYLKRRPSWSYIQSSLGSSFEAYTIIYNSDRYDTIQNAMYIQRIST